jgi:hypothetical protein
MIVSPTIVRKTWARGVYSCTEQSCHICGNIHKIHNYVSMCMPRGAKCNYQQLYEPTSIDRLLHNGTSRCLLFNVRIVARRPKRRRATKRGEKCCLSIADTRSGASRWMAAAEGVHTPRELPPALAVQLPRRAVSLSEMPIATHAASAFPPTEHSKVNQREQQCCTELRWSKTCHGAWPGTTHQPNINQRLMGAVLAWCGYNQCIDRMHWVGVCECHVCSVAWHVARQGLYLQACVVICLHKARPSLLHTLQSLLQLGQC